MAKPSIVDPAPNKTSSAPRLHDDLAPIAALAGEWDCVETYHAGGWSPTEVKARGVDSIRVGPGGHSLIADYQSESSLGAYRAHDTVAWDRHEKRYVLFFVDSFAPGFQYQLGTLQGDTLSFAHQTELNGKRGELVRTYTLGESSQKLIVEFRGADGSTQKLATIDKTRRQAEGGR